MSIKLLAVLVTAIGGVAGVGIIGKVKEENKGKTQGSTPNNNAGGDNTQQPQAPTSTENQSPGSTPTNQGTTPSSQG